MHSLPINCFTSSFITNISLFFFLRFCICHTAAAVRRFFLIHKKITRIATIHKELSIACSPAFPLEKFIAFVSNAVTSRIMTKDGSTTAAVAITAPIIPA